MTKNNTLPSSLELIVLHFRRELHTVFTDKGAMLVLFGAMLLYPLIYSIGYSGDKLNDLSFGIVDLDQSSMSRKYSQMLDATSELQITQNPASLKEAQQLFLSNKISGFLYISKGFEKDILEGKQTHIALYTDGSYFLKYKTGLTAEKTVNAYFNAGVSIKRYMIEGKSLEQAKVAQSPINTYTQVLYNPNSSYGSYIMPSLILIIIQQTLLIGIGILGGSFSASKKTSFILSDQKRKKEIIPYLLGKSGAYLLIALFNVAYAVILMHHWFSYPDKANIIHLMMLLLPFLLSIIFMGIALSTLFKHRESAIVFMVFISPIAVFLCGISWPASAMPEWIVALSNIFPGTLVMPAYLKLRIMGVNISEIRHDIILLYIQAGVYLVFSIVYFYLRINADTAKQKEIE